MWAEGKSQHPEKRGKRNKSEKRKIKGVVGRGEGERWALLQKGR